MRGVKTALFCLLLLAGACGGRSEQTSKVQSGDGGANGSGGSGASAGEGGATGSAGNFGTGGNAGSGGSGGVVPRGTCENDADCLVYNDCCDCYASGPSTLPPACAADCDVPVCDRMGISSADARCVAGRCVLDRGCPGYFVPDCFAAPLPMCPDGYVRFFDHDCDTGCLPLTACREVDSCERCEQAGLACVLELFAGRGSQSYHCVTTPAGCDGGCECMHICNEPGATCQPRQSPTALECSIDCPTC